MVINAANEGNQIMNVLEENDSNKLEQDFLNLNSLMLPLIKRAAAKVKSNYCNSCQVLIHI